MSGKKQDPKPAAKAAVEDPEAERILDAILARAVPNYGKEQAPAAKKKAKAPVDAMEPAPKKKPAALK